MSENTQKTKLGWGKAPKKGVEGIGRPKLTESEKKPESKTVSVRLPIELINQHNIDGSWLWYAAMNHAKVDIEKRLKQQGVDNEVSAKRNHLKQKLIEALSIEGEDGDLIYKNDSCYEIAGILKELGVL